MTATPTFTFSVTPSNFVNGFTNDYLISVTSTISMRSTDIILFTFPSTITLPTSISCSGNFRTTSVSCSKSGSAVRATVTLSSSPLSAGSTFDFYVKDVKNAPNTIASSAFTSVSATDSTGATIATYSGTTTVATTTPASVVTYSMTQASTTLGA
jgi:hypothetical protein